MKKLLLTVLMVAISITFAIACTTIAVTKGASVDGSTSVTHSCDSGDCDFRLIYVPAMDHAPGSRRNVYPYVEPFPRYNGKDFGPNYDLPGYPLTEALGSIEQVPHTYAYFMGSYGIMNEHQLSIGECTCSAKVYAQPKAGERIFDISSLSMVALERCTTAREAIKLMGELGVRYGYYGWGETLTIADTKEVWVFEMCGDPSGKSALWAARKVPDGEIFVEANEFRIRELPENDPNVMFSPNLKEITKTAGWWDGKGDFDWLRTVSTGEYTHPYYSLRRVWRIMDRLAPSLKLSAWVEDGFTKAYPFSVKPEKKVTIADVIDLYRDWYQDTEFDLSKGIAAGPFGNINRYSGSSKLVKGDWERAISIFRASYTFVTQSRDYLPDPIGAVLWYGADCAHSTAFVPFYCGMSDLPKSYQIGNQKELDRNAAWWAFNYVSNLADLKFNYMIKDIQAKQREVEGKEFIMQPIIEQTALELYKKDPAQAISFLTQYCSDNADSVYKQWWDLADYLMVKYQDGYVNIPNVATSVGYPDWWLKAVEIAPILYQKPAK
jgi:dipeptidase